MVMVHEVRPFASPDALVPYWLLRLYACIGPFFTGDVRAGCFISSR